MQARAQSCLSYSASDAQNKSAWRERTCATHTWQKLNSVFAVFTISTIVVMMVAIFVIVAILIVVVGSDTVITTVISVLVVTVIIVVSVAVATMKIVHSFIH